MAKQTTLFQTWGYEGNNVGKKSTSEEMTISSDDEDDQLMAQAMEQSVIEFKKESQRKTSSGSTSAGPSARSESFFEERPVIPNATPLESLPGFDLNAGRTWIYPTNLPIRSYQFSIVQSCLFQNTLVALPTGLGKTLIAAVVMYNFFRWYPEAKIVFMAPTKPLVAQQIEACYKIMGVPQSETAEMTGNVAVAEREKSWKLKRVFFMTPQVMSNDLSRGLFPAHQVKLLVVDEAHRAQGEYAYCQVVRELQKTGGQFRVVALSATPGTDLPAVKLMLRNLLISRIELRSEESPDIVPYTFQRKIEKVVVPLGKELLEMKNKFLCILEHFIRRLSSNGALMKQRSNNPSHFTKFGLLKCREEFRQNPPGRLDQSKRGIVEGDFAASISLYHAYELLLQHGMRPFYNFLMKTTEGPEGNKRLRFELNRLPNWSEMMSELKDKFCKDGQTDRLNASRPQMLSQFSQQTASPKSFTVGHPKLDRLRDMVLDHFRTKEREGVATRVMIFSQYRDSVQEIAACLHTFRPLIKVMEFVGQAGTKGKKGLTQKEQIEVVRRFRTGGFNTLVATCVGEEGLDIGEVDLIVCYDVSKSPIRLVQRMGRTGRKRAGRIIVLVTQGKEEQTYNQSMYSKNSINKAIMEKDKLAGHLSEAPRMVPRGLNPVCHKMAMVVGTFENAKSASGASGRKTTMKNGSIAAKFRQCCGYLDDDELSYWSLNFKTDDIVPSVKRGLEMWRMPLSEREAIRDNDERMFDLGEWRLWQNGQNPTRTPFTTQSKTCRSLTSVLATLQTLEYVDEDYYGLEMRAFLNMDDVCTGKPSRIDDHFSSTQGKEHQPDVEKRSDNSEKQEDVVNFPDTEPQENDVIVPDDIELEDFIPNDTPDNIVPEELSRTEEFSEIIDELYLYDDQPKIRLKPAPGFDLPLKFPPPSPELIRRTIKAHFCHRRRMSGRRILDVGCEINATRSVEIRHSSPEPQHEEYHHEESDMFHQTDGNDGNAPDQVSAGTSDRRPLEQTSGANDRSQRPSAQMSVDHHDDLGDDTWGAVFDDDNVPEEAEANETKTPGKRDTSEVESDSPVFVSQSRAPPLLATPLRHPVLATPPRLTSVRSLVREFRDSKHSTPVDASATSANHSTPDPPKSEKTFVEPLNRSIVRDFRASSKSYEKSPPDFREKSRDSRDPNRSLKKPQELGKSSTASIHRNGLVTVATADVNFPTFDLELDDDETFNLEGFDDDEELRPPATRDDSLYSATQLISMMNKTGENPRKNDSSQWMNNSPGQLISMLDKTCSGRPKNKSSETGAEKTRCRSQNLTGRISNNKSSSVKAPEEHTISERTLISKTNEKPTTFNEANFDLGASDEDLFDSEDDELFNAMSDQPDQKRASFKIPDLSTFETRSAKAKPINSPSAKSPSWKIAQSMTVLQDAHCTQWSPVTAVKGKKRKMVVSSDEDDSPLALKKRHLRMTPSPPPTTMIKNRVLKESFGSSANVLEESYGSPSPMIKKRKKKKRNAFIDDEAELSGASGSGDELDDEDLDHFEASFVDDGTQRQEVDHQAMFVRDMIQQPRHRERQLRPITDDIFSQMPTEETDDEYDDSFVVDNDEVEFDSRMDTLDLIEEAANVKSVPAALKSKSKRRRIIRTAESSEDELLCGKSVLVTPPTAGKKKKPSSIQVNDDVQASFDVMFDDDGFDPEEIDAALKASKASETSQSILPSIETACTSSSFQHTVLVNTSEVNKTPDLISALKHKHSCSVHVRPFDGAGFIVSRRIAIDRVGAAEFGNGAHRHRIIERCQKMCELFERPYVVVERRKEGESRGVVNRTKYNDMISSQLGQSARLRVMYSGGQEETADIVAALLMKEERRKMALPCPMRITQACERTLPFYQSLPGIGIGTALVLAQSFRSVREFLGSALSTLMRKGNLDEVKAKRIHAFVRRNFQSDMTSG